MSEIPAEIAEYGDTKTKPRQNPEFQPGVDFGTEDYYVWTRCDGASSVHDIILMVGLGTARSIEILMRLRGIGAVLLPGESRPPPSIQQNLLAMQNKKPETKVQTKPPSAEFSDLPPTVSVPMAALTPEPGPSEPSRGGSNPPSEQFVTPPPTFEPSRGGSNPPSEQFVTPPPTIGPRRSRTDPPSEQFVTPPPTIGPRRSRTDPPSQQFVAPPPPPTPILTLDKPTKEESAAMAAEVSLPEQERIRILLFRRRMSRSTLFELLGVETDTDMRNVKRAYFRLSKDFHPDRHFGKDIGPFEGWLSEVFKAITDAFKVLGNKKKRAKYEASLRGGAGQDVPQTKEDHAEALFQNACDSELHGDSDQALKLFAAAIRMDEQARYLRRAAMCAVQARKLSVAEEYAKKAADLQGRDASYQRVLADVYRAGAQYNRAKEILVRALTLNVENDTLYGELQADLAAVEAAIKEALADSQ